MSRYHVFFIILLASIMLSVLSVNVNAQVETIIPVTIYNPEPYTLTNITVHIVLTPDNATFPINLNTLYVTRDDGSPLPYAYNIPELDMKVVYAVKPSLFTTGYQVNYTLDNTTWNTGLLPIGNYTVQNVTQILDDGLYSIPSPRTEANYTWIHIRYTFTPPYIQGYRTYRVVLGVITLNGTVKTYINGYLSTPYLHGYLYLYNITRYAVNGVNTVDIMINDTSNNEKLVDTYVAYYMVPDYSDMLSLWVTIPELKPGYNVVLVHYGAVNIYPQYNNPSLVFKLYDGFNDITSLLTYGSNYTLTDGYLYHTGSGRDMAYTGIQADIGTGEQLVIKTLVVNTMSTSPYDVGIVVSPTNTLYYNSTGSYTLDVGGGGNYGFINLDGSYTTIDKSLPVYEPLTLEFCLRNSLASMIESDPLGSYTNQSFIPPSTISTARAVALVFNGYGLADYITVYKTACTSLTVTTGYPPNYTPPKPYSSGTYFNVYFYNTTVFIQVTGLQMLRYNTTLIRAGFINDSFIRIVYSGEYAENSSELIPLKVYVYGDNNTLIYNTTFIPLSSPTNIVMESVDVNVTGYSTVKIMVYDATSGKYVGEIELKVPEIVVGYGYTSYLAYLIPVALLILFTVRGSFKGVAVGFMLFGIVTLMLQYMGVPVPYPMVVSAIAIFVSLVLLWMSSRT